MQSNARRIRTMIAMTMLAKQAGVQPGAREPNPSYYRVHLSKAERKGKTFDEIQRMRAERARG
jgi:NAD(P)H-nitrite reductase large subunit